MIGAADPEVGADAADDVRDMARCVSRRRLLPTTSSVDPSWPTTPTLSGMRPTTVSAARVPITAVAKTRLNSRIRRTRRARL